MKELHDAAAAAGFTKYTSHQSVRKWIGTCRYSIHLPYVDKYNPNGSDHPHAIGRDIERAFRGLYIALNNEELCGGGSLLAEAIDETGPDAFGTSLHHMRDMDKPENALLLKYAPLGAACKVLAYIADAMQSRAEMRDLDRAFWSNHLGAVHNDPSVFDTVFGNKRSRTNVISKALRIPSPDESWERYLKLKPKIARAAPPSAVPVPPPGPTMKDLEDVRNILVRNAAVLVQNAYDNELLRLRTGGAAPQQIIEIGGDSELMRQFAEARDRARADFLKEQPPPPAPEAVVPPAPPEIRWPDDTEPPRPTI